MSKGVGSISVGPIINPYNDLGNKLSLMIRDRNDKAIALEVRNESERRFNTGQANLLEERGIRAANRIEDNKIKAAALKLDTDRYNTAIVEDKLAAKLVNDYTENGGVYEKKDHSAGLINQFKRVEDDLAKEHSLGAKFLLNGDDASLKGMLQSFGRRLNPKDGETVVNQTKQNREDRFLALHSQISAMPTNTPEDREAKTNLANKSMKDLLAPVYKSMNDQIARGAYLTAESKLSSYLRKNGAGLSTKSITWIKANVIRKTESRQEMLTREASSVKAHNAREETRHRSEISSANSWKKGNKGGDKGFTAIMDTLDRLSTIGFIDEDRGKRAMSEMLKDSSGISKMDIALAMKLGQTAFLWGDTFPAPESKEYETIISNARRMSENRKKNGGNYSTNIKSPKFRTARSVEGMFIDKLNNSSETYQRGRLALNAKGKAHVANTIEERQAALIEKKRIKDEEAAKTKSSLESANTPESKLAAASLEALKSIPKEHRAEVLAKQEARRKELDTRKQKVKEFRAIFTSPFTDNTPQEKLVSAKREYEYASARPGDGKRLSASITKLEEAQAAVDVLKPRSLNTVPRKTTVARLDQLQAIQSIRDRTRALDRVRR